MAIIQNKLPSFDMFDVKKRLVDLTNTYFQLENIDTYESGFLGYLIESLTALTSDTLFHNSLAYNEAFLTKAVLPSSIYNLASMLDYKAATAKPATGSLTLQIPLSDDDMYIKILAGSPAAAGSITYKVAYNYYIKKVSGNISIIGESPIDGTVTMIPYSIEIHNSKPTLVFDITVVQTQIYTHEFIVSSPRLYVFYEERVTGLNGFIYNVAVTVDDIVYHEIESIYDAGPYDKVYEVMYDQSSSTLLVKFGNGIYGFQPQNGAVGRIVVTTTLGSKGNTAPNTIRLGSHVVQDYVTGRPVSCNSFNKAQIVNGYDGETLEEIRRHTIENISAAKRLVTENDYKGFQGVTGLTNIHAAPYLVRRDVHSNEVSLYIVKFDNDNKPVPTTSIRVPFDEDKGIIAKGTRVVDDDITYVIPFNIELDTSKALPIGRYYYVISDMNIAPKLYSRTSDEDVLMGVRQIEAQINIDINQPVQDYTVTFITNIFKFADMFAENIAAKLDLYDSNGQSLGIDTIDLSLINVYDNGTTCIFSSDPALNLTLSLFPNDDFKYKVTLYWKGQFYNTYEGTMKLKELGMPVGSEVQGNVSSSTYTDDQNDQSRYFHINSITYTIDVSAGRADVSAEIIKLQNNDTNGHLITPEKINLSYNVQANGKTYPMTLYAVKEGSYVFNTGYQVRLDDTPIGSFDWYLDLYYDNNFYNKYNGSIEVLSADQRPVGNQVASEPTTIGQPAIELVKLSITSLRVIFDDSLNAFKMLFVVSRLPDTVSSVISASILIGTTAHIQTINKGDGGASTTLFESEPIAQDSVPLGSVPVTITLYYQGNVHSVYKQHIIMKADLSNILYSHIHKASDDGKLYAYNVPVIEETFYNNNIEFIDQCILSELATLSQNFTSYKMLTDRVTVRFAKTFGWSRNMQLNQFNVKPAKVYEPYFKMNIPPKMKIEAFVSYDVKRPIPEITEDIRDAVYTFLQLKAGFHLSIYRSEIARFIHDTVDGVLYCHVHIPNITVSTGPDSTEYLDDDIVYAFDLDYVTDPETIRTFVPEYIWFDKNVIDVIVQTMDIHYTR